MEDAITYVALMCHDPVVWPELGRDPERRSTATMRGMEQVAQHLVWQQPDVVVVLSPLGPRHPNTWYVHAGPTVEGDLGPDAVVALPGAPTAALQIEAEAGLQGIHCKRQDLVECDLGALVPLLFLSQAGWRGQTLWIRPPQICDPGRCEEMGRALARSAHILGQRWAIIASGDLGQRWRREGRQDQHVLQALRQGQCQRLRELAPGLRTDAPDDLWDTLTTALGSVAWRGHQQRIWSHEAPFGASYLVATLYEAESQPQLSLSS